MKRLRQAIALAPFAVLVWLVWGLIDGSETLFFRDVFNLHLPAKLAQVRAWTAGELAFVDPYRAGGQPGLGNPNTLPLYPDNLLYLIAPDLWAFNAHMWLHLLIAPWSCFWLLRRFGLGPLAAWTGGVVYGTSGYVLSQMSFYNLMPGVALAPAFMASALWLRAGDHRARAVVSFALLWALLLLGGEPIVAALAFGLAGLALISTWRSVAAGGDSPGQPGSAGLPENGLPPPRFKSALLLMGGTVAGGLIALPQYVELYRILGTSYRGFQGFSEATRLFASWDPRRILDWFLPLPYGEPLLTFWGKDFFGGDLPLFWSLYPGILALALISVSGWPRPFGKALREPVLLDPVRLFAWLAIGGGLFLALGRHNPLFGLLLELPGAGMVRFPIKFFLPVAVGASCLAALGAQRLLERRSWRPMLRVLGVLALGYLVASAALSSFAGLFESWLGSHLPAGFPDSLAASIRLRWLVLSTTSAAIALGYALILWLWRRKPAHGVLVSLLVHALLQAWLLGSLVMTDDAVAYRTPSPLLAYVATDETIAHGNSSELFGVPAIPESYPDPRLFWVQRRGWQELYPFAGVWAGRRYELNVSAEGLDSYLSQVTLKAMNGLDDRARLQVLRGLGVDVLILGRELAADAAGGVSLRAAWRSRFGPVQVYQVDGTAPDIQRVTDIHRAANLNETLEVLLTPGFDPRASVVLGGQGPPRQGPDRQESSGQLEVLELARHHLRLSTAGPTAAAVVIHRSHLPLYRAAVDGRVAPIAVANMTHMAIEVPPGEHVVELWTERRPFYLSLAAWPLALVLLTLLVVGESRSRWRPERAAL